MSEDSINDVLVLNTRDDPDRTAAAAANFNVDIEHTFQSLCPGHRALSRLAILVCRALETVRMPSAVSISPDKAELKAVLVRVRTLVVINARKLAASSRRFVQVSMAFTEASSLSVIRLLYQSTRQAVLARIVAGA